TTYYYVVQAVTVGGTSSYSIEVSVTIQAAVIAAPTHVTAISTNTQVNIGWDDVAGATSYIVLRATVADGPYTVIATNVTNATYLDDTLPICTTYYYVVQAVEVVGTSSFSIEVSVTIQAAVIAAPTHVIAVSTNTQVNIGWDDVAGATS